MRHFAAVLATSLAALLCAAPPALAQNEPPPDRRAVPIQPAQPAQNPELQRVRSKIQYLRDNIKRQEDELARLERDAEDRTGHAATHDPSHPPLQHIDHRIVDAEARLVELRNGRRYTEHHPDVKAAVEVLAQLQRLRQKEADKASRAVAAERMRVSSRHAGARNQIASLRAQLGQLTAAEHDLLAAMKKPKLVKKPAPKPVPKPAKVKKVKKVKKAPKPPKPALAMGGERRARAQPGVEDRLARLKKAVKELTRQLAKREAGDRERDAEGRRRLREEIARRGGEGQRGRDGEGARGGRGGEGGRAGGGGGRGEGGERRPDVEREREHLHKLRIAFEAERQESEGLRKIIDELEQRVRAEREESEELREMVRRLKAKKGGQSGQNRAMDELEKSVHAERAKAEELRRALKKLEERLHGELQESEELRRMVRELEEGRRGERRERGERGERGEHGERDGEFGELRGHVRGLERRLKVEQHENAELREVIEELEAEMKAFRRKLERK